jgi:glutamate-5-semialdehyde dehydrogenase
MSVTTILQSAKQAAPELGRANTKQKNELLALIADALEANSDRIIEANQVDLANGAASGLTKGLLDRLTLTQERISGLASAVREIIALPDPVGELVRGRTLANGIRLAQVRVPFGVIGCIYEARPNVTVDIAALAIKSGNAAVLRGGSAAEQTNKVLVSVIQSCLAGAGFDPAAISTVDEYGRDGAVAMMQARGLIDVLIPRGSANLIQTVVTESKVPVIETGDGIVHLFVDESAVIQKAVPIIINSKAQRPSVCNSLETLLVHEAIAQDLFESLMPAVLDAGITVHGCSRTQELIDCVAATDADWATEYLSLDLSVKIVADLDEALEHISRYSTHHTESILTESIANADRFLLEVDSAAVMVNTSTRFTDGGEFGFGAEVGISTQKMHARGPMGLAELTSTKWLIRGDGQIRG